MKHHPFTRLPMLRLGCLLMPLLQGCGSSAPLQLDRYYVLEPEVAVTKAPNQSQSILLVNDLAARGFLGGRQILYRTHERPLLLERYDTYLWAEPLPHAMAQVLANAIREAGLFRFVVIPADRARADYLLGGQVDFFEHRPTDQPARVIAALNLSLVQVNDRRSLWARRYSGEEPLSASEPDAMAEAFNRLAARLAAEVVEDLLKLQSQLNRSITEDAVSSRRS